MPQFKLDFSALCVREGNPRVKNHEKERRRKKKMGIHIL